MTRPSKTSIKQVTLVLCTLSFVISSSTLALAEKRYNITISCCAKGDPCKPFRISCEVGTLWNVCAAAACGYKVRAGGVKLNDSKK